MNLHIPNKLKGITIDLGGVPQGVSLHFSFPLVLSIKSRKDGLVLSYHAGSQGSVYKMALEVLPQNSQFPTSGTLPNGEEDEHLFTQHTIGIILAFFSYSDSESRRTSMLSFILNVLALFFCDLTINIYSVYYIKCAQ